MRVDDTPLDYLVHLGSVRVVVHEDSKAKLLIREAYDLGAIAWRSKSVRAAFLGVRVGENTWNRAAVLRRVNKNPARIRKSDTPRYILWRARINFRLSRKKGTRAMAAVSTPHLPAAVHDWPQFGIWPNPGIA